MTKDGRADAAPATPRGRARSRCMRLVVLSIVLLVAVPSVAAAEYTTEVPGFTTIATADGYLAWDEVTPADDGGRYGTHHLLRMRTPDGRVRTIARRRRPAHRFTPFDATIGRASGRLVVLYSRCRRAAHETEMTLAGVPDLTTGRDCRLRAYDVKRRRTRTLHTGRGSTALPSITTEGRVLFVRRNPGVQSVVQQTLGGRKRRSIARIADVPTSLTGSGPLYAWTTAKEDDGPGDGATISHLLVLDRDRTSRTATVIAEGRTTDRDGIQLNSATLTRTALTYLRRGWGQSAGSNAVTLPLRGQPAPAPIAVPTSARWLHRTDDQVAYATEGEGFYGPLRIGLLDLP